MNRAQSPLSLRLLRHKDLAFADSLRALVGWNQTFDDWERFLALEPDGCFLAECNGAPAGTATTLVYGPDLAWIGMALVHPDYRRRGIGRALLERCLEHLRVREVRCVKLDATPLGKRPRLQRGMDVNPLGLSPRPFAFAAPRANAQNLARNGCGTDRIARQNGFWFVPPASPAVSRATKPLRIGPRV